METATRDICAVYIAKKGPQKGPFKHFLETSKAPDQNTILDVCWINASGQFVLRRLCSNFMLL